MYVYVYAYIHTWTTPSTSRTTGPPRNPRHKGIAMLKAVFYTNFNIPPNFQGGKTCGEANDVTMGGGKRLWGKAAVAGVGERVDRNGGPRRGGRGGVLDRR